MLNTILNSKFLLTLIIWPPLILISAYIENKHKERRSREQEFCEAASDFYKTEADLKQHLKDDGFIQPEPGSEEHYRRWKAEREKREP